MSDTPAQRCRVYVIEDDAVLRLTYLRFLAAVPDTEAVGFESAEEFLKSWNPDLPGVIVLDNLLPGISGAEFVERNCPVPVDLPVVMISGHASVPLAIEMTRRGVANVVEKPVDPMRLREAVTQLVQAEAHARPRRLDLREFRVRMQLVSPREREVLALLVEGLANKEVGAKLGISPRTVEIHRARLHAKLGVGGIVELMRRLEGSNLLNF